MNNSPSFKQVPYDEDLNNESQNKAFSVMIVRYSINNNDSLVSQKDFVTSFKVEKPKTGINQVSPEVERLKKKETNKFHSNKNENESQVFEEGVTTKQKIYTLLFEYFVPILVSLLISIVTFTINKANHTRCFVSEEELNCSYGMLILGGLHTFFTTNLGIVCIQYLILYRKAPRKECLTMTGFYLFCMIVFQINLFSNYWPSQISVIGRTMVAFYLATLVHLTFSHFYLKKKKEIQEIQKNFLKVMSAYFIGGIVIVLLLCLGILVAPLNPSLAQQLFTFGAQPLISVFYALLKIILRPNKSINPVDFIWIRQGCQGLDDGMRVSVWLTIELNDVGFWYNIILYFITKLEIITRFKARFLNKLTRKIPRVNKFFKMDEPTVDDKYLNGAQLFEFRLLMVILILRAIKLPFRYDSVYYNWSTYSYGVVDGVDFASLVSIPKLAVILIAIIVAGISSYIINKKGNYEMIKIYVPPTENWRSKVISLIIGCLIVSLYEGFLDIGMFATRKSTRFWDYYKAFIPQR